jgi:hypothetical protein
MIYYDERWLTIRWDDSVHAVWAEYKGYAEGEEFRAGHEVGLNLLRQKRASRWVSDARQLAPVRQVDQEWTNNDFFPRGIAFGWRWLAIVSPKAAVARMSAKQVISKINKTNFTTNNFDSMEAARAWLRNETTL